MSHIALLARGSNPQRVRPLSPVAWLALSSAAGDTLNEGPSVRDSPFVVYVPDVRKDRMLRQR